jgi:hypothetical protein
MIFENSLYMVIFYHFISKEPIWFNDTSQYQIYILQYLSIIINFIIYNVVFHIMNL